MSSSACRCAASMMSWRRPPRAWSARRLPDAWLASYPGVREHEQLARHSWYRIGGAPGHKHGLGDDGRGPQAISRGDDAERDPLAIARATHNPENRTRTP